MTQKKSIPLRHRVTWEPHNKSVTLRGNKLSYNASQQAKYVHTLTSLVKRMTTETQNELVALFKTQPATDGRTFDANLTTEARILTDSLAQRFQALFASVAPGAATKMAAGAAKASKTSLVNSLKKMSGGGIFKSDFLDIGLGDTVKNVVKENVDLIKLLPGKYFNKVKQAVMNSVTTGNGLQDLIPALEKYQGVSHRHAKNTALDQTRKAYNGINAKRMKGVGIHKFEWLHSGGDQKPRPLHLDVLNGTIYSLDNLPVIDLKTGQRGKPGDLPNCTCTMRPIIEFDEKPK